MICQYCGNEFESKRTDTLYCSDKCRKAMAREIAAAAKTSQTLEIIADKADVIADNSADNRGIIADTTPFIADTKADIADSLSEIKEAIADKEDNADIIADKGIIADISRQELCARIHRYPDDTWCRSPEYRELIRRLKAMSLYELAAEGYDIPNWRRHSLPCPIVLHAL